MAILKLEGIEKSYALGKSVVRALRGVDLSVEKGEFTALMGPSGSGKTTLLNLIGCLDRADAGHFTFDGQVLDGRDFDDLAEIRARRIGFIFQAFHLLPVLDVLENIEFPLRMQGEAEGPLRERARKLAVEVGLGEVLHHKPDELSGGQRQRVAIARALVAEPTLILADEPTANLDRQTSEQILDLLERLNREHGVTFLFSTHDPKVVTRARRVVHLADGKVVEGAGA